MTPHKYLRPDGLTADLTSTLENANIIHYYNNENFFIFFFFFKIEYNYITYSLPFTPSTPTSFTHSLPLKFKPLASFFFLSFLIAKIFMKPVLSW